MFKCWERCVTSVYFDKVDLTTFDFRQAMLWYLPSCLFSSKPRRSSWWWALLLRWLRSYLPVFTILIQNNLFGNRKNSSKFGTWRRNPDQHVHYTLTQPEGQRCCYVGWSDLSAHWLRRCDTMGTRSLRLAIFTTPKLTPTFVCHLCASTLRWSYVARAIQAT